MDEKIEKTERYFNFLKIKQEKFSQNVTRIGAKLMELNDGDFGLENYIQSFVPSRNHIKNRILKQMKGSQVDADKTLACPLDSDLVDALKTRYMDFEKDFKDLLRFTYCDDRSSVLTSIELPAKQQGENDSNQREKKQDHSASRCLEQTINPDELSKIFVQKHRTNIIRSVTDKPNFDDDNVETFYIYRSKH